MLLMTCPHFAGQNRLWFRADLEDRGICNAPLTGNFLCKDDSVNNLQRFPYISTVQVHRQGEYGALVNKNFTLKSIAKWYNRVIIPGFDCHEKSEGPRIVPENVELYSV